MELVLFSHIYYSHLRVISTIINPIREFVVPFQLHRYVMLLAGRSQAASAISPADCVSARFPRRPRKVYLIVCYQNAMRQGDAVGVA